MAKGNPLTTGGVDEINSGVKLSGLDSQKPNKAAKMFKRFTPPRALGNPSKSLKGEGFTKGKGGLKP